MFESGCVASGVKEWRVEEFQGCVGFKYAVCRLEGTKTESSRV